MDSLQCERFYRRDGWNYHRDRDHGLVFDDWNMKCLVEMSRVDRVIEHHGRYFHLNSND